MADIKKSNNTVPAWICVSAIALVTFIVFSPSLNNGFTNWDDGIYTGNNPLVTSNTIQVAKIFKTPVAGNYHPLTVLSLALNYQFGKLDPIGYHAVNIIFHLLNTILVFFFIFLLTRRNLLMASIVSLFFGIHPMHVESVTWISERKDVLYVFFFMAALISYLFYTETRKSGWYIFTLLLFLLSCLSKGMAVVFPVILLLIDYLKGIKWDKWLLIEKIPFFIMSVVFGVIAIKAQQSGEAISDMKLFTIPQRLIFAAYGAVMYIIKFFVPVKLSAFYPYPDVYGSEGVPTIFYVLMVVFLILIAATIYFFRKKEKEIVFGLLFYFTSVVLILQLITVGSSIIADRYSYLSYTGLLFIVAYLFNKVWVSRSGWLMWLKYPVALIIIVSAALFAFQTYARTQVWNNGETLWTDVINNYQGAAVPYTNRAAYYLTDNEINKALSDYNTALKLDVFSSNAYRDAYYNRGLIYYNKGKYDSAFFDLTKVINIAPSFVSAYTSRGNIYYDYGKYNLALADYKKALSLLPDDADAWNDCGLVYYKTLKDDSALACYNKAIALNAGNSNYYYNRGLEYRVTNQLDKAVNDFTTGINLNPPNAVLFYNMRGLCYTALNNYDKAIDDFSDCIQLNSSVADYWLNRSLAEEKAGEKTNAQVDALKAQQLQGK